MTAITKQWYDYLEQGRLMGLKCKRCGTVHFPPYPICRECSGMDMEWVEVSGEATLEGIALVTGLKNMPPTTMPMPTQKKALCLSL